MTDAANAANPAGNMNTPITRRDSSLSNRSATPDLFTTNTFGGKFTPGLKGKGADDVWLERLLKRIGGWCKRLSFALLINKSFGK